MSTKVNLKKYLARVLELETEKQRLEEINDKLKRRNHTYNYDINKTEILGLKYIRRDCDNEISDLKNNNTLKEPTRPVKPLKPKYFNKTYVYMLILAIFLFVGGIGLETTFFFILGGIGITIVLIVGIAQLLSNKQYQYTIRGYEEKLMEYYTDKKKYDEDVEKNNKMIEEESKIIKAKYDKQINEKKQEDVNKKNNLKLLVKENDELMEETNNNLEIVNNKLKELYDLDIIFEKYRSLIPISSFYEYLASSRVDSLEGRDGAYNLYETELRQNIIIIELANINKNLEAIKNNQYCLYKGLMYINDSVNAVNDNLEDLKVFALASTIELVSLAESTKNMISIEKEINRNIKSIKEISASEFLYK